MAIISNDIDLAANYLKKDEIIAIPTETVYGLAGNAFSEDAILKIYTAKNRPLFNPLIIHTYSLEQLRSFVKNIPENAIKLAKEYMPGPLTLLLEKQDHILDLVTAGSNLLAVRIPNHALTINLLSQLDFPLVAPSANPFGFISPTKAIHVQEQLGDKIPFILDGGECQVGLESTIVSFNQDGIPVIERFGGLEIEKIKEICNDIIIGQQISDKPDSPGKLKSHYAPKTPSYFGLENLKNPEFKDKNIGLILFDSYIENYESKKIDKENQLILSPNSDLSEAAKHLFSSMRLMDARNFDFLIFQEMPYHSFGYAINDRLKRACS